MEFLLFDGGQASRLVSTLVHHRKGETPLGPIGFIGLGIMGKPMARSLLKAGYALVVYDVAPGPVAELTGAGAEAGRSSADTASRAEMVITMLPDGPDVEKAVLGPGGVLEGARPGALVVDM